MTVSIVMSMHNRRREIVDAIDNMFFPSLLKQGSSDKELIVLDDCSTLEAETRGVVEKYSLDIKKAFGNFTFVKNDRQLGFAGSYNRGIGMAQGSKLLIVNDDIYFPLGSVDDLTGVLDESSSYGMVGPVTNAINAYTYQYSRQAPKLRRYSPEEFARAESFSRFLMNLMGSERLETDILTGYCIAIPTDLMRQLGCFDERFSYGYFEDTDLSKKVSRTHKLVIHPGVFVHHGTLEGPSRSAIQQPASAVKYNVLNFFKYARIWGMSQTMGHVARGVFRGYTGFGTISEDIEKRIREMKS